MELVLGKVLEIEQAPLVSPDETCKVVDDLLRSKPQLRSVVVVDAAQRPIGLVDRNHFLLQLSQRFGRALYENRPVEQVMLADPLIVSESTEFDEFVSNQFMRGRREYQDIFVLTDDHGRYRGVSCGRAVINASMRRQQDIHSKLSESRQQLVEANKRLEREVAERRTAETEAVNAARRDPLTGLFNRAPFVEMVKSLCERKEAFFLVFIDLDGFKLVNDVYGHLAGDAALLAVARRLRDAAGPATCARFGGDEFAVVVTLDQCPDGAEAFSRQLHQAIVAPFQFENRSINIGASLGLAGFPGDAVQPNELLQAADMAMLRAKREGGGVRLFDQSVDENDQIARTKLSHLTNAISAGAIPPYFQPIFTTGSRQVVLHEVLSRWPGETSPLGQPARFIELAEREGLIDGLFWNVFAQSCQTLRRHDGNSPLAFNVSARQLQSPEFPSRLLRAIERQGLEPCRFEVEVTETAMISNEKLAETSLRTLSAEGIAISLDDFGTGYSSLSLLHKLSFNKLKIDNSFVRSMTKDNRSRDIVESTILMASQLGLATCAEGVEDEKTLRMLEQAGCDLVQGFFLARPGPGLNLPNQERLITEVA